MPEQKTIERARRDKRAGKAPTTQAGEFVHEGDRARSRRQARGAIHETGDRDWVVKGPSRGREAAASSVERQKPRRNGARGRRAGSRAARANSAGRARRERAAHRGFTDKVVHLCRFDPALRGSLRQRHDLPQAAR